MIGITSLIDSHKNPLSIIFILSQSSNVNSCEKLSHCIYCFHISNILNLSIVNVLNHVNWITHHQRFPNIFFSGKKDDYYNVWVQPFLLLGHLKILQHVLFIISVRRKH